MPGGRVGLGTPFALLAAGSIMAESKKHQKLEHQPHGRRDRDSAFDRPQKRQDDRRPVDSGQDVDAAATEADDTFAPDKDGTDGTGW